MITMAVGAIGCVRIAAIKKLAVGAGGEHVHHFGVTYAAINLVWHGAAGTTQVRTGPDVALGARLVVVNRTVGLQTVDKK